MLQHQETMPIYEYQALNPEKGCRYCRSAFEVLQGVTDKPKNSCPECGGRVRKIISRCHAAIFETPEEHARIRKNIKEYENAGMWSHAAELADKHSEKTKDGDMRLRALDNYKKAGYDARTLEKHANIKDE